MFHKEKDTLNLLESYAELKEPMKTYHKEEKSKNEITKEYIKIDDKIYYRQKIKTIEFIEEKQNLKDKLASFFINISVFGIIYMLMILPIFFVKNIYTVILFLIAILFILGSFAPIKTKYNIFIDESKIYTTENEKEFLEIKEKIYKN